jgi:hypothetical protein
MFQKLKGIIIFAVIITIVILVYVFYFKGDAVDEGALTSSGAAPDAVSQTGEAPDPALGEEFLVLLLNIQNIKLDGAIFEDPAFKSLQDSSIELVQDIPEGRPNPFAPIGSENQSAGAAAPVTPQ